MIYSYLTSNSDLISLEPLKKKTKTTFGSEFEYVKQKEQRQKFSSFFCRWHSARHLIRRTLKQGLGGRSDGELSRILECYDATRTILVVRQSGTVISSCAADTDCYQAPYHSIRGPHDELTALDLS